MGLIDGVSTPTDALLERASALLAYEIVDHTYAGLPPVLRRERPTQPTLDEARYYLAGVNSAQREIYDEHCVERYADRSPHHYSSRVDVAARSALSGEIWAARAVYEVTDGALPNLPSPLKPGKRSCANSRAGGPSCSTTSITRQSSCCRGRRH